MASTSKNFTQAIKELTGFDNEIGNTQSNSDNYDSVVVSKDETSIFTSTMVITGMVRSNSPVAVDGRITGDIKGKSDITINGLVVGDIEAGDVTVMGKLKGDVKASEGVNIGEDAVVLGNIEADNVVIKGKLRGNLDVTDVTNVAENAIVSGNIITDRLISAGGAFVGGSITTKETPAFMFDEKIFDIGE